jgi:aspartyl-tRNA(Asn)/glutamyl-tRNA(Gln) amidotransferase subunit A
MVLCLFASSLDQAGPMTATVKDAALMLEVMCGQDPKDQTTSQKAVPQFSKQLNPNLKGKKIGILKQYNDNSGLSVGTQKLMEQTYQFLKSEGAELVEVSVPLTSHGVSIYYLIASSEASSNLARYDGFVTVIGLSLMI